MEKIVSGRKYFPTQSDDEKVLIIARRHWVVYLPGFIGGAFVTIFCLIILFNTDIVPLFDNQSLRAVGIILFSLMMLYTALIVYVNWLINYLNVQIVTDEHIVDVNQVSLFHRKISELSIDDVEDVTASKANVFQSFLHYGNVKIQTAGELNNFLFEKVKNPYEISRQIMSLKDDLMDRRNGSVQEE